MVSLNMASALVCNLKRIGVQDQVLLVAMDEGWIDFFADDPNLVVEYSETFNKLVDSITEHTRLHTANRVAKLIAACLQQAIQMPDHNCLRTPRVRQF